MKVLTKLVLATSLSVVGCTCESTVAVNLVEPAGTADDLRYELRVYPDALCPTTAAGAVEGGLGGTIAQQQEFTRATAAPVGQLQEGHHTFVVVARQDDCRVVLWGCTDIDVGEDGSITVELEPPVSDVRCAAEQRCDGMGHCEPEPPVDAGPLDDAGGDGSAPNSGVPCDDDTECGPTGLATCVGDPGRCVPAEALVVHSPVLVPLAGAMQVEVSHFSLFAEADYVHLIVPHEVLAGRGVDRVTVRVTDIEQRAAQRRWDLAVDFGLLDPPSAAGVFEPLEGSAYALLASAGRTGLPDSAGVVVSFGGEDAAMEVSDLDSPGVTVLPPVRSSGTGTLAGASHPARFVRREQTVSGTLLAAASPTAAGTFRFTDFEVSADATFVELAGSGGRLAAYQAPGIENELLLWDVMSGIDEVTPTAPPQRFSVVEPTAPIGLMHLGDDRYVVAVPDGERLLVYDLLCPDVCATLPTAPSAALRLASEPGTIRRFDLGWDGAGGLVAFYDGTDVLLSIVNDALTPIPLDIELGSLVFLTPLDAVIDVRVVAATDAERRYFVVAVLTDGGAARDSQLYIGAVSVPLGM